MKLHWARVIAMIVIALVAAAPIDFAFADAGGFSGSSDYSSGGHSSSSSGSSSDDGLAELIFWLIMLAFEDGHLSGGEIAIFVIAIAVAIAIRYFMGGGGSGGSGGGKKGRKSGKAHHEPVRIADNFDGSKLMPLATLSEKDPLFDQSAMVEKISNWYVQMQNAWTAGDFEPMRPYFSDALFSQFQRQLDAMTKRGETNYVDRIAVLGVDISGWYKGPDEDFLVAKVRTRIVDYTTNSEGKIILGSNTAEKFMTYRWILSRSSDAKTKGADALTVVNCPNCAAALNVNKTARCPYCDSVITVEEHDWVITSIQGLEQITA